MFYLAKNEKGAFERIQVVYKKMGVFQSGSFSAWGALNHDGTNLIVPFVPENATYDSVLNILTERYQDVRVSKRKVDKDPYHIVCLHKKYYLYDNKGACVEEFGTKRISFSAFDSTKIFEHQATGFSDYLDEISEVHEGKLWVAHDIDTDLWVCFLKDETMVSQSLKKKDAIFQAVQKLS